MHLRLHHPELLDINFELTASYIFANRFLLSSVLSFSVPSSTSSTPSATLMLPICSGASSVFNYAILIASAYSILPSIAGGLGFSFITFSIINPWFSCYGFIFCYLFCFMYSWFDGFQHTGCISYINCFSMIRRTRFYIRLFFCSFDLFYCGKWFSWTVLCFFCIFYTRFLYFLYFCCIFITIRSLRDLKSRTTSSAGGLMLALRGHCYCSAWRRSSKPL